VAVGLPDDPGGLLREHRRREGLSQRELAQRAGVSVRALRDIEQGRVLRPRDTSMRKLLGALPLADPDRVALLDRFGIRRLRKVAGADVHIGVLGPLIMRRRGAPLSLDRAMPRTLLSLLALHAGEAVSITAAIDVLWGDQPPRTCHNLIQVYIGQLRRLFDPEGSARAGGQSIRRVSNGYLLDSAMVTVDVVRFDALFDQAAGAQAAGDADAAAYYLDALRCWRGPVLGDGDLQLRHHPRVVRLAQRRVDAAIALADLALSAGPSAEALDELRDLCTTEPLHEGLHARLIRALGAAGEQAAALHTFRDLRDRLVEQLGVSPGPEAVAAYLQVLRAPAPSDESVSTSIPSPPAGSAGPAQLPPGVSGFTGRVLALQNLDGVLDGADACVPIVVVTGPGGIGKTALAVHWAHRVRSDFPDGQLYVNLRGYAPGGPVQPIAALTRFLHALGVPAEQIPAGVEQATDTYRSLMFGRRVLIILDNARHASQVRPLLPGSPGCVVIVTSRNRLRGLVAIEGARLLALDVLSRDDAHALLCRILGDDRVKAEADAVDKLIQACGGLPLALRIAAANLADETQCTIADYADRLMGRPLATLRIDGDEQVAVRAAFDLSYGALPAGTRKMFRLLGLVPGPDVTAAAAAALAGTDADEARQLLDALAEAHLADHNASGRYTMHDLLRAYAQERVREEEHEEEQGSSTRRLYEYYLHTADAASRLLYPSPIRLPLPQDGSGVPRIVFEIRGEALAWLDEERPNLVAAATRAAEHGLGPMAWLLCDALRGYLQYRMYTAEWESVTRCALAAAEAYNDVRARAVCELSLARFHRRRGFHKESAKHHKRVLALARQTGWPAAEAIALVGLGSTYR
jgi:DNA-binding SARP family transcriptional activator